MNIKQILKDLDFNDYETQIYLTLNKLNSATATQISQNSDVPRNKVYEVIESMIENGFVMTLPVSPRQYKITSLQKLREVVREKREKISELRDDTKELIEYLKEESLSKTSKEKVWIIKSQKNIVEKISYEMTKVEEETLSLFRNNAAIGSTYRNTKNAIERGVKIKMIGCVNEKSLPKIKPYLDMGVEFRVYNEKVLGAFGTRFSMFDKKKCRITIGSPEVDSKDEYTTIWIESPSLVRFLRIMYMNIWEQCESIEDYLKRKKIDVRKL